MTQLPTYDQYRATFAGRAMPFAFVDLDLLDENIRQIRRRAGDMQIRLASKSVRSVPILRHILNADENIHGIMAFTVPEALFLIEHGFDDLLLGYPCWDEGQIEAICAVIRTGKTVTLMVDSVAHIEHLAPIAARCDVVLPLCLDIDLSLDLPGLHFGVWRSSVVKVDDALNVYDAICKHDSLRLDGVMGYEAQIAGVGDRGSNLRSRIIRVLQRRSIPQIAERRQAIVEALKAQGAELRFVNGGGTGSIESTIRDTSVTEVTAGSGYFAPGLFDHYRAFKHLPAAGFAVQIVRQPSQNIYTCLGGGYIASGSTGKEKLPVPYLPEGASLFDLEGAGEVQTPVRYGGKLVLGDPVFFRHSKAGELCERFNTLLLVRHGEIIDEVPTYRGEGRCFL